MRFMGDGSTATREQVEQEIRRWLERWESWGLSLCSLERREDGRIVGRAGFLLWDPETWEIPGDETELGWLLVREHWGRGYATEAALALRDWAFEERGLRRRISLISHENVRSLRVAERIGERYERDIEIDGKPGRLYAVER
jgi:ribosomal-protein-alanine N-acetyltransferase